MDGVCSFKPRARTGRDFGLFRGHADRKQFQATRPHGARHKDRKVRKPDCKVSSHAPARGATGREEAQKAVAWAVSSHAPARGATRPQNERLRPKHSFKPRARTGRDDAARNATTDFTLFQATRPHGARRVRKGRRATRRRFQATRPHGARRLRFRDHRFEGIVSSHAPARGATNRADMHLCIRDRFQATRPHGARHRDRSNC